MRVAIVDSESPRSFPQGRLISSSGEAPEASPREDGRLARAGRVLSEGRRAGQGRQDCKQEERSHGGVSEWPAHNPEETGARQGPYANLIRREHNGIGCEAPAETAYTSRMAQWAECCQPATGLT